MRDDETIKVAHMRHQAATIGSMPFADNVELNEEEMLKAIADLSTMFEPSAIVSHINEIGPKIMHAIAMHEGVWEGVMRLNKEQPEVEDAWITGLTNIGIHMFYIGMFSERIKQEEKAELAERFDKLTEKLNKVSGEDESEEG